MVKNEVTRERNEGFRNGNTARIQHTMRKKRIPFSSVVRVLMESPNNRHLKLFFDSFSSIYGSRGKSNGTSLISFSTDSLLSDRESANNE